MSYAFTEDFTVMLPDLKESLINFSESDFKGSHGLVIELAAIHAGATANFNYYSEEALAGSVDTWLDPHPKPIIMNHDPHSEPIGRVMGAKMDKEADGTPYTRLQVAILDPSAIEKVADGRYLTGSVGGRAKEALCSVCKVDWANPKESSNGLPCKHRRGKVYNGKVAMMEMQNISFKEYSIVNMPADGQSSIRKIGTDEAEKDTWTKPARFFVLDMVEEDVIEYAESGSRNVFEGMRRKELLPMYMGMKGAFITAQAIHEEEVSIKDSVNVDKPDTNNLNEEIEMPKDETATTEEDILAVAEGLSADLSAPAEDEKTAEETPDEIVDETKSEEEAANEDEEAAVTEEGRPAGQERPHPHDVDPENSDGAPISREEETTEDKSVDTDTDKVEETADETKEEVPTDSETKIEEGKTELTSETDAVEPQITDLTQRVSELEEENTRLKTALKRQLVERVVDTKIALGMIEADNRTTAIEEHSDRTGASLGDSLRDLAKIEPKVSSKEIQTLEMEQIAGVVGNEKNVTTIGDEEIQESEVDPTVKFEDLMTDVLMGRKKA